MKKIIVTALVLSLFTLNITPLAGHAIVKPKVNDTEMKLAYINMNWWQEYRDPYLAEYITRAVENNQDLKIATLRVEEARQAMKIQFANELPTFTVGAAPSIFKGMGSTSTTGAFAIPLVASYELDIFLKNRDKTRSAKKTYEASKFQEQAAYLTVAGAVGTCYYNLVKLDKLIEIQEQIIKDRKQIYELMKESNGVGLVSTADLVRADKSYTASTSEIIDLKKAQQVMLNSLAVLVGDTPENTPEYKRISYDEITVMKAVPQSISSDVIENRPDYLVAQKMIEKAGIDVRVAKKEFLPSFNIVGGVIFQSMTNVSMNWANSLAALGGGVLLPIFTGGKRIANLKIKKNKYEQVLQNYQKTNITAIKEVNDSLSNLKLDNEKYAKNVKTLDMENADFAYTQLRYKEGIISYLDLLQRQETKFVVEKAVVASKIDCYVNQISLYKSVAGQL